jgi:hypothetical protein
MDSKNLPRIGTLRDAMAKVNVVVDGGVAEDAAEGRSAKNRS